MAEIIASVNGFVKTLQYPAQSLCILVRFWGTLAIITPMITEYSPPKEPRTRSYDIIKT